MKKLFFQENMIEILDYLEEGLHIIDNTGKIIYYNSFAQKIDGVFCTLMLFSRVKKIRYTAIFMLKDQYK